MAKVLSAEGNEKNFVIHCLILLPILLLICCPIHIPGYKSFDKYKIFCQYNCAVNSTGLNCVDTLVSKFFPIYTLKKNVGDL